MFGFTKIEPAPQENAVFSALERRAEAWLAERLRRGAKEDFYEKITLTPQMATKLLALNTNNRPLQRSRVAKYLRVIQEGRWKLNRQGIVVARNKLLIDGQHRLKAIAESGVSVQTIVWFGADPAEFATMDIAGTRTGADMLAIEKQPYGAIRAAVARHLLQVRNRSIVTPDTTAVRDLAMQLAGHPFDIACSSGSQATKIVAPSNAAFAYYTIATQTKFPDRLPEFWDLFVTGAIGDKSSPILKLRESLRSKQMKEIYGPANQSRMAKVSAAVIFTWNAWVRKRKSVSFTWDKFFDLPEVL